MKAAKILAIVLLAYVAIVAVFESLLGYFQPQADGTLVLTTFDAEGRGEDRVLSALDSGETLYVAVNHWPRAWYRRALANPAVRVARDGEAGDYVAVEVTGDEYDRLQAEHPLPTVARFLMGFAPRRILRLDPSPAPSPAPT